MSDEPSETPSLTDRQLKLHEQFAWMELSVTELVEACLNIFEFSFTPTERRFNGHFRIPEPGVLVTKKHIENALMRRHLRIVSERDLVLWATMILLNDAFEIESSDEDLIAEWLNDFSLELDSFDDEKR